MSSFLLRAPHRLLHLTSSSSSSSTQRTAITQSLASSTRTYISRAHPSQIQKPIYSIPTALQQLLDETAERATHREQRWLKFAPKRDIARSKGSTRYGPSDGPEFRNQDETVDVALNLNLDPRKPLQSLRGSIALPHGTGKRARLAVFVSKEEDKAAALAAGASVVGGEELITDIKAGVVPVDFDRVLADKELLPFMQKNVARILGPRGVMPSAKLGTVMSEEDDVTERVRAQLAGLVNYRVDKEGIIHAPVGKASFGYDKLMENIKVFMVGIIEAKPDVEGKKLGKKGRKKKKGEGKFLLRAHVSAQQGRSWKLNVKSVDPGSPYFMEEVAVDAI